MKKTFFLSAAVFVSIIFTGCCVLNSGNQTVCCKDETSFQITGNWKIEDLPSASEKKIKPAPNAEINFTKDTVNGCAGDNRFFGSVKFDGNNITFSQMGMTKMMGPNSEYETCFIEALNDTAAYAVKDKKICLVSKDGKILIILKPVNKK